MRIRNQEDFLAGLMFIAFGVLFLAVGTGYPRGTAGNMGPGYVPVALGTIVVMLGALISGAACRKRSVVRKVEKIHWFLVSMIAGPVVLFGLLLPFLGLLLSIVMVVGISSLASHEFSWRSTVGNAAALVAISWFLFIWVLGLPFPVWPWFAR